MNHQTIELCENCGKKIGNLETPQVFNDHIVCPDCAGKLRPPIASYAIPSPGITPQVVTIEATGKKWKGIQAIGAAGMFVSTALLFTALGLSIQPLTFIAAPLLVASIIVYAVARIGGWWHHG